MRFFFNTLTCLSLLLILSTNSYAQPAPCGPDPEMTSFCDQACVICDIDGFTGRNDLTATGQGFPEFCTTQYNNMQYIAFIAGTENLRIRVDVSNCTGSWVNSLEVGFFETDDCLNFDNITICDTDINSGDSQTFTTNRPLVIGKHYYLIIDGSGGANCDWTFNVLEGSTSVNPLSTSGEMRHEPETCPNFPTFFGTTIEEGAAIFDWTINGILQPDRNPEVELMFPNDGVYEVCVQARNSCDEAPPTCSSIRVRTPGTLEVDQVICFQDCLEYNGKQFCESGSFQEIITFDNGCDSTINIELEVLDRAVENIDIWICNDEFFYIGDVAYNETGSYTGTVLSSLECDSLVNLELLVIECEIRGSTSEIPVICKGTATGTLVFSVDQGQPPLRYTYRNIADPTLTGMGQTDLLNNIEINNVPAGTYQIYIEDDFGNDGVLLQEVTEPNRLELDFVPSDFVGYNVSCESTNGIAGNDGFLSVEASGGVAPYAYLWSDDQTTQRANNLEAKEYTVTITDDVGCSEIGSYTLIAPPGLEGIVEFRNPTCESFNSGQIEILNVFGGVGPYEYAFGQDAYSSSKTTFEELYEGSYTVFIRDANGCVQIIEDEIVAPQIPVVSFPEDITLILGDSIQLFPTLNDINIQNITWSPDLDLSCTDCLNPFARPVNDSEYNINITSEDDCLGSASINFKLDKQRRVYVPNTFSPNADGINDVLPIFSGREVENIISFSVFDRWGNKVFEENEFLPNNANFGWDGSFRGKKIETGIYVWKAKVLYIDAFVETLGGNVTLTK